jgi:hypothetical protein
VLVTLLAGISLIVAGGMGLAAARLRDD